MKYYNFISFVWQSLLRFLRGFSLNCQTTSSDVVWLMGLGGMGNVKHGEKGLTSKKCQCPQT